MIKEPIKILSDIVQTKLALPSGRVILYDQNFKLPEDDGLFVIVQYVSTDPYSITTRPIAAPVETREMEEEIVMRTRETYTINIVSRDDTARIRKEEVLMAFSSAYASEQQELYEFSIARISNSFVDISEVEGSSKIRRFAINVVVLAWYLQQNSVDFYDDFSEEILTD